MWNKPWTMREGSALVGGLMAVGGLLQITVGPISWSLCAFPVNIILFAFFLFVLGVAYALHKHSYVIRWCMTLQAAIPAMAGCMLVTLCMGISGCDEMLSAWPLVLVYVWMMALLGLTTLNHLLRKPSLRQAAFVCNHFGLFLAMTCGVLGHADMQRLRMTTSVGSPEWRAVDVEALGRGQNGYVELPLSIELHRFTIDEYPPSYQIIDNETGQVIPESGWSVHQDSLLEYAAIDYGARDSLGHRARNCYVEYPSVGACTAAYITATDGTHSVSGWVTCGSFRFPLEALRLDDRCSVVMPDREPQRYASEVTVYTGNGARIDATIEVNRPLVVNGWKIYQVSYDATLGRWSDTSVFELVRDPWLPWVYAGIFLMLAGAVATFVIPQTTPRS